MSDKVVTIRADKLNVGDIVNMTLYGLMNVEDGFEEVEIIKKPDVGVQEMRPSDRIVIKIVETNETIEFRKNTSKPFFLITDIMTKHGNTKQERVKFWKYA